PPDLYSLSLHDALPISLKKLDWKSVSELLEKDFKSLSDRLMQSTKTLPDSKAILAKYATAEGTTVGEIAIPVRRLTQHFLEYNFLSPLHDEIDRFCKKLKDNVVTINDELSLTLFSIDNADTDDNTTPQIIAGAIDEIKPEEAAIKEKKHELTLGINTLAEKLFQALTGDGMVAASVEDR